MDESMAVKDYSAKFGQLTEQNQKYILAIQQALLYAQTQDAEKTKETKKMEDEK